MTTATELILKRQQELAGPAGEISDVKIAWLRVFVQEAFGAPCCSFYFDLRENGHYNISIVPMVSTSQHISKKRWQEAYGKIANKIGELPRHLGIPSYTIDFVRKYDGSGKDLLVISQSSNNEGAN